MKKLVLVSLITTALTACGGGSSSSENSSSLVSGKAIDGYIIGATVFLDLNFNGQLDPKEPSTVTEEEGEFALHISDNYAKCAEYVPVTVDVPVGAIDTDYPDTPITEAYTMVFPPHFTLTTDQDLINLTPLTSVVWDQVERELQGDSTAPLTCETILNGEELRKDIKSRLSAQELRVARRYNITVNDLYGDYVASGDTEIHAIAQAIVPSLQKSYVETKELIDSNPDASIVWVEYFSGKFSSEGHYLDSWYRTSFVQASSGNFESETHEVSEDLNHLVGLFSKQVMASTQRDGLNIQRTVTVEQESDNYSCSNDEEIETVSGQSTSGIRSTYIGAVEGWEQCASMDEGNLVQSKLVRDTSSTGRTYAEFVYHSGNVNQFRELAGITDTITSSDIEAVTAGISRSFYDESNFDSDFWYRVEDVSGDDPTQVMTMHDSHGQWERNTFYKDGTHKTECGTSADSLDTSLCSDTSN
ncbi:hypothetical protein JK628_07420 [Shewanella sp. KX20019]|uniref:hypothetical protein n=1 Tax=Shewanella sp. KX20019 TaxID=2803864 RepID=UPI001925C4FC|nr:hypothetical protein [Shewanella sp. KX20019]QQX81659.1 hypothetical protein JK628_07420 [Shewanella sp. KX20019]